MAFQAVTCISILSKKFYTAEEWWNYMETSQHLYNKEMYASSAQFQE